MYSALASIRNIELEECEVTLKAHLNVRGLLGIREGQKAVYPGFSNISYETKIISSESKNILRDLVEDVEKQCPVMDMLTRSVSVEGSTQINDELLTLKSKHSVLHKLLNVFRKK